MPSIGKEHSRNTGICCYKPQKADKHYKERVRTIRNARRIGKATLISVVQPLELPWSPEQIAAFLPISHETIDQRSVQTRPKSGHIG
jgi:IS30 family transposase